MKKIIVIISIFLSIFIYQNYKLSQVIDKYEKQDKVMMQFSRDMYALGCMAEGQLQSICAVKSKVIVDTFLESSSEKKKEILKQIHNL